MAGCRLCPNANNFASPNLLPTTIATIQGNATSSKKVGSAFVWPFHALSSKLIMIFT
jgi:hypothetical protein